MHAHTTFHGNWVLFCRGHWGSQPRERAKKKTGGPGTSPCSFLAGGRPQSEQEPRTDWHDGPAHNSTSNPPFPRYGRRRVDICHYSSSHTLEPRSHLLREHCWIILPPQTRQSHYKQDIREKKEKPDVFLLNNVHMCGELALRDGGRGQLLIFTFLSCFI